MRSLFEWLPIHVHALQQSFSAIISLVSCIKEKYLGNGSIFKEGRETYEKVKS
jgi:hypothetical protein